MAWSLGLRIWGEEFQCWGDRVSGFRVQVLKPRIGFGFRV